MIFGPIFCSLSDELRGCYRMGSFNYFLLSKLSPKERNKWSASKLHSHFTFFTFRFSPIMVGAYQLIVSHQNVFYTRCAAWCNTQTRWIGFDGNGTPCVTCYLYRILDTECWCTILSPFASQCCHFQCTSAALPLAHHPYTLKLIFQSHNSCLSIQEQTFPICSFLRVYSL